MAMTAVEHAVNHLRTGSPAQAALPQLRYDCAGCRVSSTTLRRVSLGVAASLVVIASSPALASDDASLQTPSVQTPLVEAGIETLLSPDSLISRDEWQRRIEEARKRAAQAGTEWRQNAPQRVLVPDPPEKIATQRVLNDDTLQPGDIVSTDKGLLLFRGR